MRDLAETRLIYLAPEARLSGVGDYADDFLREIRPRFGEVVEIRHGAPGDHSFADIFRMRRRLNALIGDGRFVHNIVHSELSGGAVLPFWAPVALKHCFRTATIHDAPYAVWYPYRSRWVAKNWFINHSIHFPTKRLNQVLERHLLKTRSLFALTEAGADACRKTLRHRQVYQCVHIEALRADITNAEERPLAVGLFGHVYKTKGFHLLPSLRALIDDDINIRVAGRGTDALSPTPGVEVLGEVNGKEEDDFFESVRAVVIPYGQRLNYGRPVYPASGVMRRAISYQTPVIWATESVRPDGGGVLGVGTEPKHIAAAVNTVLRDGAWLTELRQVASRHRAEHSAAKVIQPFLDVWSGSVE